MFLPKAWTKRPLPSLNYFNYFIALVRVIPLLCQNEEPQTHDPAERAQYLEHPSPHPSSSVPWGLLTQVIWLQAANTGPDWVMCPLCWTSTSYQVSHKGSFIKLDSPLIFIALIKGHKRLFFLAFGVWIIISINWAPFNIIDPEILISKRQLPTRSMKDQLVHSIAHSAPTAALRPRLTSAFVPPLLLFVIPGKGKVVVIRKHI